MDDILRKFYYDPELGLISANKLHQKVKEHVITLKQVKGSRKPHNCISQP